MISVIVPVYKVEKYLRKCVESIRNQTYKDLEIVLVDDGSPDHCGKICDELAQEDKRIHVIHQENGGLAAARNRGLDFVFHEGTAGRGDFVGFVDSDDTIGADMYRTMLDAMDDNCDLVICGHQVVKENEAVQEKNPCPSVSLDEDELWEEVFARLNNAVWNKLYRCELIGDLRFPTGVIHGEDLIFNLNYLRQCRSGVINRTEFYNYLKRKDSITTGKFNEKKLMEITSKDAARDIVSAYKLSQLPNAEKFCFRARMNVLRAIYKANAEKMYEEQVSEYGKYVRANYRNVRGTLRIKEKTEYFLYTKLPYIYRQMTRMY